MHLRKHNYHQRNINILTSQDRPKADHRAPKPPQEPPRTLPRRSKKTSSVLGASQISPKDPLGPPEDPPRTPNDPQRHTEERPGTSQGAPSTLQAPPSTHQAPPRTPQAIPKTPEDFPRTLAGPPMTCRWTTPQSGPAECAKRLNKMSLSVCISTIIGVGIRYRYSIGMGIRYGY